MIVYNQSFNRCIDCGINISKRSTRCYSCANKKELNPQWKGGRKLNKGGYTLILQHNHPRADLNGYVFEHILVMETHLKRYISKKEIIHHINEIKTDNRIKNLKLFKSNGDHSSYHQYGNYKRKDLNDDLIIELYKQGLSCKKISIILNCSHATIHKRLIYNNIERRTFGGKERCNK